jgi:cytochrome o ubiquinol oxidase subunit II
VFFIPQLGSMIYTMNGMTTQLHLQADQPGSFAGLSSHFSGDGFSGMHFDVQAVPAGQFSTWVETTRKDGPVLDPASYTALSRQSMNTRPFTFRSIEPQLFQKIVSQELPPGPGPQTGVPDRTVSSRTEE